MFINQQYEFYVSDCFADAMCECEANDDAMNAFISL